MLGYPYKNSHDIQMDILLKRPLNSKNILKMNLYFQKEVSLESVGSEFPGKFIPGLTPPGFFLWDHFIRNVFENNP